MLPNVVNVCTKEHTSLFFVLQVILGFPALEESAFFPLGEAILS